MRAAGTANESRLRKQGRAIAPLVEPGIPAPPPDFHPSCRPAFDYYADLLNSRGVLSLSDGTALALLAWTHTQLVAAQTQLTELGPDATYQDAKGRPKQHPVVQYVRSLRRDLYHALGKFGLTPADRERVAVIASVLSTDPDDPWNKLESNRRN